MIPLLLALLVQQPATPDVSARVDRDAVGVGEELVLTVQASGRSSQPLQMLWPPFDGFEIASRSERTEVAYASELRTTTWELHLRARAPGHRVLGPFKVVQDGHSAESDSLEIEVLGAANAVASTLSPRVRRLLEGAPPPRDSNRVAVTVVVSDDTVSVGEQVDVVTAAWFPRELRLQMRRPPTLEPPVIQGVWSYPQPSPSGIASSRLVSGRWYDLFILHQIVFPLTPGVVRIAPATLHYSVPMAIQFFSQEDRYALNSEARSFVARGLPPAPAAFTGAIGRGLSLSRVPDALAGQVGEPISVQFTVEGAGNVTLWPAPAVVWPDGVHAYPDHTDERIEVRDGLVTGSKTFRFLVVPDSAGAGALPAVVYPYFDLATRQYVVAGAPAATMTIAHPNERAFTRVLPPPLRFGARPALARLVIRSLPGWAWGMLLLLPPLAALVPSRVRRLGRRRKQVPLSIEPPLVALERELDRALAALAPGTGEVTGERLTAALRAAGMDALVAGHAARVRDRLRAARFGPGPAPDARELESEARGLLKRLDGSGASRPARRGIAGATVVLALVLLPVGRAQGPGPEQLYDAGALRAAAEGFARRAASAPGVAANWYNLGATHFRLRDDAFALAEWSRAARLTPRNRAIRRALDLVPPADDVSAAWLSATPVTPDELALVALLAWLVGWVGVGLSGHSRPRGRWALVLASAVAVGGVAVALDVRERRPLAVVSGEARLLRSPTDRAPAVASVAAGSAVRPLRAERGWQLVRASNGGVGWLPDEALHPVAE